MRRSIELSIIATEHVQSNINHLTVPLFGTSYITRASLPVPGDHPSPLPPPNLPMQLIHSQGGQDVEGGRWIILRPPHPRGRHCPRVSPTWNITHCID